MSGKVQNDEIESENFILYQYTQMQKDKIVQKFKMEGGRMTRQRELVLDIILNGDCSCCKEIYYRALEKDPDIGVATIYRMVNKLEEMGVISRKNMYKIENQTKRKPAKGSCVIELEDDSIYQLNSGKWKQVMEAGLKACGYTTKGQRVKKIIV